MINGGEGGIRTHGTFARTTVFETAPFDHSGTSPQGFQVERGADPTGRLLGPQSGEIAFSSLFLAQFSPETADSGPKPLTHRFGCVYSRQFERAMTRYLRFSEGRTCTQS